MTKRQIWIKYQLIAVVLSLTFGGLSLLVGRTTNLTVQIIFLVVTIVPYWVWNNRATKRAWHSYYFNADESPKQLWELH